MSVASIKGDLKVFQVEKQKNKIHQIFLEVLSLMQQRNNV
jgi:hypothetical protein